MRRPLIALTALNAWGALALQFTLMIAVTWSGIGPWLATLKFFSYFTILCNLLVGLSCTFALVGQDSRCGRFFGAARVRGAVALYIAVTGGIYIFVLRTLWAPQGAQWLADVMLHYATPLLYLVSWSAWLRFGRLEWTDALRWLLFPLAYMLWTLLRGAWLHDYPYPVVNVDALGMARTLVNALAVSGLFLVLGLLLIALDRALRRRDPPPNHRCG